LRENSLVTPVVLVHGGGLDSRCWDPLLPHLDARALAVDLPGRGAHPAPLDTVTFADCAQSVRSDVDAAGFDDIALVGHSLAGCSMPAMIELLGDRVRHAVFVACTVPDDGTSSFDTLDPDFQQRILEAGKPSVPRAMDEAIARIVLGTDLTEEQFAWCSERLVPEAPRLNSDPSTSLPCVRRRATARGYERCRTSSCRPRSSCATRRTSATARSSTSTPVTCAWSASRKRSPPS
jgi:pimeloyl-ACP methyl ester carboxylesterase